jgi:site-specific DNA recombinase
MSIVCAVYARFSSEKQNASSIEDQIRKCREFATRHGWTVSENHIYRDAAVSGASDQRDALNRMLEAATSCAPEFNCVLVDDTSRLSRSLGDTDRIVKRLNFAGVKTVYVAQGFDSESESAGMLTAIFGGINEQYLVDLGKKTFRGVEGLAKRKLHTGGRCFGYKNVSIEDQSERDSHGRPVIRGVRLEVDPEQAKVCPAHLHDVR